MGDMYETLQAFFEKVFWLVFGMVVGASGMWVAMMYIMSWSKQ